MFPISRISEGYSKGHLSSNDFNEIIENDDAIRFEANVNVFSKNEMDLLFALACEWGKPETAKVILRNYPDIIHKHRGESLLLLAVKSGNLDLVRQLFDCGYTKLGYDVNHCHNAFELAVKKNHLEIVKEFEYRYVKSAINRGYTTLCVWNMPTMNLPQGITTEMESHIWKWCVRPHRCPDPQDFYEIALERGDVPLFEALVALTVRVKVIGSDALKLVDKFSNKASLKVLKGSIAFHRLRHYMTPSMAIVQNCSHEKISELISKKLINPFQNQLVKSSRELDELFTALGRRSDVRLLNWFEDQFDIVRVKMKEVEALEKLFIQALKNVDGSPPFFFIAAPTIENKLEFCFSIFERYARIGKRPTLTQNLNNLIWQQQQRLCAFLFSKCLEESSQKILFTKVFDNGIENLTEDELNELLPLVQAKSRAYEFREDVELELERRK